MDSSRETNQLEGHGAVRAVVMGASSRVGSADWKKWAKSSYVGSRKSKNCWLIVIYTYIYIVKEREEYHCKVFKLPKKCALSSWTHNPSEIVSKGDPKQVPFPAGTGLNEVSWHAQRKTARLRVQTWDLHCKTGFQVYRKKGTNIYAD